MPKASLSHERAANGIARRVGAEYNKDKGVDVVTQFVAIEVETEKTVRSGLTQLQGYRGPVYIAGSNQAAVAEALEATKGSTVGVMDKDANVLKESTRRY